MIGFREKVKSEVRFTFFSFSVIFLPFSLEKGHSQTWKKSPNFIDSKIAGILNLDSFERKM